MPKIQQYVAQGSAGSGTTGIVQVNPVSLGGLARGVSAVGGAAEALREHQDRMREKLDQDEAALHVTNTMSQAGVYWQERIQKAQTEAPSGAGGFTDGLLKEYETWSEGQVKSAPERAKPLLQKDFARFRQGLHAEAFRFEVGARNKKLVADNEAGIDSDARLMTIAPDQMMDTLARRKAAIDALDMPADVKSSLAAKAREGISYYAGMTLASRNPAEWLSRDPTKDPVKSLMDPRQMVSLDDHARAAIARAQSKDLAGREAEVREATKDFGELSQFVESGGVVSPDYEQRVLPRLMAQPGMGDAAQSLVKMSRDGAGYGSLPLNHQQRALQMAKPGSPEEAKVWEQRRTITSRQEAAYKENPWAAATQYGRAPDSPPRKIAAAEQILPLLDERLKTVSQVETMAGGPVSLIRPEEVGDVTRAINSMPPERQGEIVGQMGAKMTPRQINEFTKQLDKSDKTLSLMMMAGADRTSAGVALAVRIRQGAQGLKDKTIKADDQQLTGWKSEIAKIIRGSIGDDEQETNAIEAAYLVRAAMEAEGYPHDNSNKSAAQLVVGSVYEKGGVKTLIPKGMDEKAFEKKLETYTTERLTAISPKFYIRGKEVAPVVIANRIKDMGLRMESPGVYWTFHNNQAVTLDPEGRKPLKLEAR